MRSPKKSAPQPRLIPPHGGYLDLKSFHMSQLVYDATVVFCDRFIDPQSRTHDQMVQAARSGNKNLAEGSQVSGTSKKIELKLVGIARASLEELLGDYWDFLRQRGLTLWEKDNGMARMIRRLAYAKNRSYKTYSTYIENAPPGVAANTMVCLIHQANYLIDQQMAQLEAAFLQNGGFTERLYRARQASRQTSSNTPPQPKTRQNNSSYRSYSSATPKPPSPSPSGLTDRSGPANGKITCPPPGQRNPGLAPASQMKTHPKNSSHKSYSSVAPKPPTIPNHPPGLRTRAKHSPKWLTPT